MARSPLHDAVIVGAYNTRQAKVLDQPEADVLWDAVNGALVSLEKLVKRISVSCRGGLDQLHDVFLGVGRIFGG